MLGSIFKSAVKIIKLPVSVVLDVATLGTRKIHEGKTFTGENIEEIEESLDEII